MRLIEGVDYYIDEETGLMVFTAEFHIKRGRCCGKKCRWCAYEPQYEKGNTNLQEKHKKSPD